MDGDSDGAPSALKSGEPYPIRWHHPPVASWPRLPPQGELHLWRIDLDRATPVEESLLSADEEERGARLLVPMARQRFRQVRRAVRMILGGYLDLPPSTLRFGVQGQGKPILIATPCPIAFNLSHSGALALLAVTAGTEVGVDVEQIGPRGDLLRIARRLLPAAEADALAALPPAEQTSRFFRHWTSLEARVKTRGEGVFNPGTTPLPAKAVLLEPEPGWVAAVAGADLTDNPVRWEYFQFSG